MKDIKIDFVVTWLDSSDSKWQESYLKYKQDTKGRIEKARFRNMHIFQFWFRSVERYAPWVNKVFLVTNGKFPDWINKDCPKLVLVKHEDFIPKVYLPTFNSRVIELHLHKIKGLSEHFVYFNDDMILNSHVRPEYYFKNRLPCDINKETCFNVPIYTVEDKFSNYISMLMAIGVINSQFKRWETVVKSPLRWWGLHLGLKGLLVSCLLIRQRFFIGFSNYHTEQTYLKSVFNEVWERVPELMTKSCTRFREDATINPYIFRYWQLASNRFEPQKRKGAFFFIIKKEIVDKIEKTLNNPTIKSICINDCALCKEKDFEYISTRLEELLEKKFPQKSSFEI